MKILNNLFLLIVLLNIFIAGCSGKDDSESSEDDLDSAVVVADKNASFVELILAEVTAVTTPNIDNTPNYTFSSTKAGVITYGGSCTSDTTVAVAGNNTITLYSDDSLTSLSDGTYSDCTITVNSN